jgi:integrase/recombinase XerC
VLLNSYVFHLKARNLAPSTVKATVEYLRPFLASIDPLEASKNDVEAYLGRLAATCAPSTVWTAWRHLKGFYSWLEAEGDIEVSPMARVPRPIVPPTEVTVLTKAQVGQLLKVVDGVDAESRRDRAIITMMLDTGLRLSEVAQLTIDDIAIDGSIRVFGKGRKWRTVALGVTASSALRRWMRHRPSEATSLWAGRKGQLTTTGIRKMLKRHGDTAGFHLHPHMLRHTFVDNWLRNGGSEVDLARLCGWTTTRMAERYAQQRADERAVSAHAAVQPLDRLSNFQRTAV